MAYEIRVNGETVWNSGDLEKNHITEISVATPRGEAAFIRVPPEEAYIDLIIRPRSLELRPLDMMDVVKARTADGHIDDLIDEFGGNRDADLDDPAPETPTPSIEEHLASQGMNVDGTPLTAEQREERDSRSNDEVNGGDETFAGFGSQQS